MYASRREFLRSAGIFLSAVVLAHGPGLSILEPFNMDSPVKRVRRSWLGLQAPGAHPACRQSDPRHHLQDLLTYHNTALDELVRSGMLTGNPASQVQVAFRAAVLHIDCTGTCAGVNGPVFRTLYSSEAAAQIVRQTGVLAGSSARGDFSPEATADSENALARAIALLTLPDEQIRRLQQPLADAGRLPWFDELSLSVSPASQSAARFLRTLLLTEYS